MTSPRILLFGAPWCVPCKQQKAVMEKGLLPSLWRYVDIEQEADLAAAHNICAVPTLKFTESGMTMGRASVETIMMQLEEEL